MFVIQIYIALHGAGLPERVAMMALGAKVFNIMMSAMEHNFSRPYTYAMLQAVAKRLEMTELASFAHKKLLHLEMLFFVMYFMMLIMRAGLIAQLAYVGGTVVFIVIGVVAFIKLIIIVYTCNNGVDPNVIGDTSVEDIMNAVKRALGAKSNKSTAESDAYRVIGDACSELKQRPVTYLQFMTMIFETARWVVFGLPSRTLMALYDYKMISLVLALDEMSLLIAVSYYGIGLASTFFGSLLLVIAVNVTLSVYASSNVQNLYLVDMLVECLLGVAVHNMA